MINFFDELSGKFKLPFSKTDADFKIIYLSSGVYLEGHEGVIDFNESEISFKLKKGKITFFGDNIFIKNLEQDSATVQGNVLKIEREKI